MGFQNASETSEDHTDWSTPAECCKGEKLRQELRNEVRSKMRVGPDLPISHPKSIPNVPVASSFRLATRDEGNIKYFMP